MIGAEMDTRGPGGPFGVAILLALWIAGPATAQTGRQEVVPGPGYAAGDFHRQLFGEDYRDLWTTPIQVGVLNLDSIAGGITPVRRGGGRQTASLRFADQDGREYSFRSIDKAPALAVHPDLEGALAGRLIQDQVSSLVPGAPVVAARITSAVGIPHSIPRIFVMPDDPRLGEFREEFAGMLGTFEEHVDEAEGGGPGFGGFTTIAGTETVLEHLESKSAHRVDATSYLTARLIDLVLGDWDRHEDQWRWVRRDAGESVRWLPVPRDRDYAMANYDGSAMSLVRRFVPNVTRFDSGISDLEGLILNARNLDRRLLAGLDRATWDSVTAVVAGRLTDERIGAAIRSLPPEFHDRRGEVLAATLRARRDNLPRAAAEFYAVIADVPEITTTDEDERAEIRRLPDGSVSVSVWTALGATYFQRLFTPAETREIRLDLKGGDDRATVLGTADALAGFSPITIRVVGGGGTDLLADSSSVSARGRWTSLHDEDEDDVLLGTRQTAIVRSPAPEPPSGRVGLIRITGDDRPDFSMSVRPTADYSTTTGVVIGARVGFTERGFRRYPYASRTRFELLYAPVWSALGGSIETEFRGFDPRLHGEVSVTATGIDALRFYGFGNETADDLPSGFYRLRRDLYAFDLRGVRQMGGGVALSSGIIARHSRPHVVPGSPLDALEPLGYGSYSSAGISAGLSLDRGSVDTTSTAIRAGFRASVHPIVSAGEGGYGRIDTHAGISFPLGGSGVRTTLRGGGAYAFGDYPFFDAAFIGGSRTLRGFPSWRFAGDAAVFGSLEMVAPLMRLPLIMNWRVIGHGFIDTGRVFHEGESSTTWHYAPGVGLTLSALDYHVNVSYAYGSKGRLYLKLGVPPGYPRDPE